MSKSLFGTSRSVCLHALPILWLSCYHAQSMLIWCMVCMQEHQSFPSIVTYVVFNEGWGQCPADSLTWSCVATADHVLTVLKAM